MEDVVSWDNCLYDDVVPENFSQAALKGDIGSAGESEAQSEEVGKSIVVAEARRRGWEVNHWALRFNWHIGWGRNLRRIVWRSVFGWFDNRDDWAGWGNSWGCNHTRSIESWDTDAWSIDGWDADLRRCNDWRSDCRCSTCRRSNGWWG